MTIKNKEQKIRFVAVGGINTIIDFSVLFTLKMLGLPAVPANVISTTIAFCFSFFANKKYTFKTNGSLKREIPLFIAVTLFGLWVLQTIVIHFATYLLTGSGLSELAILFVAKVAAIATSLVWNYLFYSRLVFKEKV